MKQKFQWIVQLEVSFDILKSIVTGRYLTDHAIDIQHWLQLYVKSKAMHIGFKYVYTM